jgi:hypothetical protein
LNSETGPFSDFAATDDEALERAKQFLEVDPFPKTPPSLLSSNEINAYVRQTGMLFPFDVNGLKTASYSVGLGKHAYKFWPDGSIDTIEIAKCQKGLLRLPANSIIFVEIGTHFRLPKYIALRFNLSIRHVHRGLLLGTGPLVDPGFDGELLIPIHNLTSRDHFIAIDHHLVWMEFTKTTYEKPSGKGDLAKFDSRKQNRSPIQYLDEARRSLWDGGYVPIESSISILIAEANRNSSEARQIADRTREFVQRIGIISIFGVALAIVFFLSQFIQATYGQISGDVQKQATQIEELRAQLSHVSSALEGR